jgi:hypothetical protein
MIGVEEIKEGYTRATTVLSQYDKMSHIPPEIVERKCAIGTNVHAAIHGFGQGNEIALSSEEGGHYFMSFLLWYRKEEPIIEQAEMRMYSEMKTYDEQVGITGCIDALVKLPGEKELTLVDWKTSANADKEAWPLQAQYYMYLLRKNGFEGVNKAMFVKLDKEANMPKIHEYEWNDRMLYRCHCALEMYLHMKPWIDKRKDYIDEEYVF